MREVNFSIPNVNKASVGITAALYDRRALDSTSTLPLINSLNHLAYLTTSSARIRDILTVDGGIERLICILKEGRNKEMMELWKWNLAFQCIVNIGVRGSEQVRTSIVEADVVPIIATILDNHSRAADKAREDSEAERRRNIHRSAAGPSRATNSTQQQRNGEASTEQRSSRRHVPPSIHIPPYNQLPLPQTAQQNMAAEATTALPQLALTSPQDPSPFTTEPQARLRQQRRPWPAHNHSRSQDLGRNGTNEAGANGLLGLDPADNFGLRPTRDTDRVPSVFLPPLRNGITSQPESPTTPGVPLHHSLNAAIRAQRRPSLAQQNSGSGDSDDGGNDISATEGNSQTEEPMVDIQASGELDGAPGPAAILDAMQAELDISNGTMPEGADNDAFNITRRPGSDGSIISTNINAATNADTQVRLSPVPGPLDQNGAPQNGPQIQARFMLDRMTAPGVAALSPRDEDVLMCLQLLAYISKYCFLRSYFQHTHLVPKLRVHVPGTDDGVLTADQEEYLLPDDYNIFPLVEKFTVRHNSQDLQYWAGVVMRNLCRKDEAQGGIRQCAYYNCGQWEQYPRQFAKCRRCRRTKYCSKECQKNAWVFHRHWCHQVGGNEVARNP